MYYNIVLGFLFSYLYVICNYKSNYGHNKVPIKGSMYYSPDELLWCVVNIHRHLLFVHYIPFYKEFEF